MATGLSAGRAPCTAASSSDAARNDSRSLDVQSARSPAATLASSSARTAPSASPNSWRSAAA
eukprot:2142166-Prymnesium_polylepis.1